jgi:hypothetical protein
MHSFRSASKSSQASKLARYGSGGSNVGSEGNSSKKIASSKGATKLKTGGKVSGDKEKPRSDKKKRGYDDGGAINTVGEEKKREMDNALASAGTRNPADKLNSLTKSNTGPEMDADTAAKVKNALTGNGMKNGGAAKAKRKWDGGGIDVNSPGGTMSRSAPFLGTTPGGMPRPAMAPAMKKGGRTGLARGGRGEG